MKNRNLVLNILGLVALTVFVFTSCSFFQSSLPTKNYYILNYKPVTAIPAGSKRPYPYTLQVGNFNVQAIFNRQNILYRFSPHQIQYYEIEQWAVRPDRMITNLVFKHLEASGLTNRVGIDFFDTRPDYRLEGMIEAIEKYDAGDMFYAHLAMSMKMLRTEDGAQVWEYGFDQRKQVYQPEMVYTVQTLSTVFQANMDIAIGQLDSLFQSINTGTPFRFKPVVAVPQESAQSDSAEVILDESGFEIIPEKPKDE